MKRAVTFRRRLTATFALLVSVALAAPLRAGSEAAKVGVDKYGDQAIRDLALKLNDQLDARQAHVAILARAGRPRAQLPKGVSYTHVAIAVFEPVRAKDGTVFHTYAVYNVYQGADGRPDRSYLKQDLVYDFVAGIDEADVAACVPIEPLQKRLLTVIRSPAYRALHTADYNIVANPWVDRYDNCVTHTLKICVAAIYQTDERARIYQNIRTYFTPTPVQFGPVQSFGVMFKTAVKQNDADPSGYQTATWESLQAFLATNGLLKDTFTVRLN